MICWPLPVIPEMSERQEGFIAPNLSPRGLRLIPQELAEGVYGLMANKLPKDNNGLVVGEEAALVIDSGITPGIGRHIQEVAAELTDKPILYLANTTFHGDHTFGNVAFGKDVTIISSRLNKASMTSLDEEKEYRSESLYGDSGFEKVLAWRKPDVVFDRFCEIDLGGRVVHLWHFGPGNGSGDTVVHVPDAKVAWVGNFLRHAGIPPMLLAGDPVSYGRSLRSLRATLEVETLVPGHGPLADADLGITYMTNYVDSIASAVAERKAGGMDLKTIMKDYPLADPLDLTTVVADPEPGEAGRFGALLRSNHELNILLTYRWLESISPK
jgi:glyoxylase-like metal-dependent hydrolase (beta-lactamase superfamily II)